MQETPVQAAKASPPLPKLVFTLAVFAPYVVVLSHGPMTDLLNRYIPGLAALEPIQIAGFFALLLGCPIYAAYLLSRGRSRQTRVLGAFLGIYLIWVNLICLIRVG